MNAFSSTGVATFHDLRRFAAEPRGSSAPEAGDAFTASRRRLPVAEAATTLFALDLPAGFGRVDALPADEFVVILSGAVSLTLGDGTTHHFEPDDSFVLTKGAAFTWSAGGDVLSIVLTYPAGGGGGTLHPIRRDAERQPSQPPAADLLVGDTPDCRSRTDYLSIDGEFVCGVWDATPYQRIATRYRHCELMHLLQGSVTFVDEAGREATFSAGDIFFVEAGATASWDSREPVAKVYAIHRPA